MTKIKQWTREFKEFIMQLSQAIDALGTSSQKSCQTHWHRKEADATSKTSCAAVSASSAKRRAQVASLRAGHIWYVSVFFGGALWAGRCKTQCKLTLFKIREKCQANFRFVLRLVSSTWDTGDCGIQFPIVFDLYCGTMSLNNKNNYYSKY